jgi:F-type H+-transporting ATPase subunit a
MHSLNLFEHNASTPLAQFGFNHPFFAVHTATVVYTWVVLLFLLVFAVIGRISLHYPNSIPGFTYRKFIRIFTNMVHQALDVFEYRYYTFIATLFMFILFCNCLIIIPGLEEPTKDLNTTFALALIAFFYAQREGIHAHGIKEYIKEYFKPFFIMFPLEILSKVATIISLSFRLFGNISGGAIITTLWHNAIKGSLIKHLIGSLFGINLVLMLFFGIFEGFIQAFVFSVLSLTYITMAVQHQEGDLSL